VFFQETGASQDQVDGFFRVPEIFQYDFDTFELLDGLDDFFAFDLDFHCIGTCPVDVSVGCDQPDAVRILAPRSFFNLICILCVFTDIGDT
jgi:hypothetical protein